MLPALGIGLREGLETLVIVEAISAFLRLRQRTNLLRRVWRASALAVTICIAIAFVSSKSICHGANTSSWKPSSAWWRS